MGGVRKNKKRKKYQFDKNRKRMKKQDNVSIKCKQIENKWFKGSTIKKNLNKMGLAYDLNEDISHPILKARAPKCETMEVVEKLEGEAHAPREKGFRITKNAVEFATFMIDKYGDDYKAMTRDKRNVLQLTWKQFRTKIKVFKGIPEQYNAYLDSKPGKKRSNKMEVPVEEQATGTVVT